MLMILTHKAFLLYWFCYVSGVSRIPYLINLNVSAVTFGIRLTDTVVSKKKSRHFCQFQTFCLLP